MVGILALGKDTKARTYVGFTSAEPLDYDYSDIAAPKRLVTQRVAGAGWESPRILGYTQEAPDFYFEATNQIRMDGWSRGRVVLVGDAGYSLSPAAGQGTTVAMVGAYVLAGELAVNKSTLVAGIASYEGELGECVILNQDLTLDSNDSSQQMSLGQSKESDSITNPDGVPDFGQIVVPLELKQYA